jgi:hypothetical protein
VFLVAMIPVRQKASQARQTMKEHGSVTSPIILRFNQDY